MRRHFILLAAVGALAAGSIFAQATAPTAKPGMMRGECHQRMIESLGLDDTQKQQAQEIFQTARVKPQPLMQQLRQDRQVLKAAVEAGDTAKIQQLSQQIGSLQGQALALRST